jgi:allophanate hydrolase subunit 1
MEIVPLGDSALIVRVREQFEDAPDETLDEVLRVFQLLQRAAIPGVIELAPAYTSVAVFFNPIAVIRSSGVAIGVFNELAKRIQSAIIPASRRHRRRTAARTPHLESTWVA